MQKRVNREPSSDIEEPICLECACVSPAVIIRSTQQRPHGIYVPHRQSHSDPRDSLIINSNLNLTSNADPRDNVVVMISTRAHYKCWSSLVFFLPFMLEFSITRFLRHGSSSCLEHFVFFSTEGTPSSLQLLMRHSKPLKELLTP